MWRGKRQGPHGDKSDAGSTDRSVRHAATIVIAVLILAVSGPFNTFGLGSFWTRLIYWTWVVLVAIFAFAMGKRVAKSLPAMRAAGRDAVTIGVFVPAFLPFLLVWTDFVFPGQSGMRPSAPAMALYLVAFGAAISALRRTMPAHWRRKPVAAPAEVEHPEPLLHRRLPTSFKGDILRLTGEGHYVRVVTTEGTFHIRMRLSDAVADMTGIDGFWTHRSHWVVRRAVTGVRSRYGRPVLVVGEADEVPVSATYAPSLQAAGLIEARGMETARH